MGIFLYILLGIIIIVLFVYLFGDGTIGVISDLTPKRENKKNSSGDNNETS